MISLNDDAMNAGEQRAAEIAPAAGRLRALVYGMFLGLAICVVAIVGYVWSTRESRTPLTQAAYDAAVERWDKNGPADYDLDIELAGNRPGKIHVEVRSGDVVRMTRDGVEPRSAALGFTGRCPECSTRSPRNSRWPRSGCLVSQSGGGANVDVGRVRSKVGLSKKI